MVYEGKPSTGCANCRKRKIKCDEGRPACSHCINTKRICPGYAARFDLMFRDQTKAVRRKAQKKEQQSQSTTNLSGASTPTASDNTYQTTFSSAWQQPAASSSSYFSDDTSYFNSLPTAGGETTAPYAVTNFSNSDSGLSQTCSTTSSLENSLSAPPAPASSSAPQSFIPAPSAMPSYTAMNPLQMNPYWPSLSPSSSSQQLQPQLQTQHQSQSSYAYPSDITLPDIPTTASLFEPFSDPIFTTQTQTQIPAYEAQPWSCNDMQKMSQMQMQMQMPRMCPCCSWFFGGE